MAIVLKAFTGIRPIIQPRLLQEGEAQIASNVKLVSGHIAPLLGTTTLKATTIANPQTIYRYGTSNTESNYWLEFAGDVDVVRSPVIEDAFDRLYWTDGTLPRYAPNNLIVSGATYPGSSYQLGVPKPSTAPSVSSYTAPATFTVVSRDYVVAFYNPTTLKESTASKVTSVQAVDGQPVTLSSLPTDNNGDTGITRKRIYRKVSGTYRLVTEVNLDVLTYEDSATDASLAGAATTSAAARPAAPKTAPVAASPSLTITEAGVSRQYVYTIVSYSTGSGDSIQYFTESSPSPVATITADDTQTVTISGLSNSLAGSFFRIYRKDPDQQNFRQINEIAVNITTTTDIISKSTLGIPLSYDGTSGPASAPSVSVNGSTGVSSGNVVRRAYMITYVNSSDVESVAGPYSNVIETLDGTNVTLTHTDAIPAGVTKKRLYRQNVTVSSGSITITEANWRLVTETSSGTTSFSDSALAASLSTALSNTLQGAPAGPTTTFTASGKIPAKVVPESRTYVYTYVTAYGEEGPPSDASAIVDVDPSAAVNLTVPSGPPGGSYNITHKRIYRSSTVGSRAQFQYVTEIPLATGSYSDTKEQADLGEVLPSEDWIAPPAGLKGLKVMANGVGVGFAGRTLYLSEPYLLHAWPHKYPVKDEIVGLGVFGQTVVVLTKGRPEMFTGIDPGAMSNVPMSLAQSCSSKPSIVDMGDGTVYASPDGLVSVGANGIQILSQSFFTREQWQALNPSSMRGWLYNGRYILSYTDVNNVRGVLIFDLSGQGSPLTTTDISTSSAITAGYYDATTDTLYFAQGANIVRFDRGSALTYAWRSKVYRQTFQQNFAAAIVRAEAYPVTFKLYADGSLRHTQTVANGEIFRLPSGFRALDYEVEVTGTQVINEVMVAKSSMELMAL